MLLPKEYETDVGQHGLSYPVVKSKDSVLARVFLKKSSYPYLDEATSAGDNEIEKAVQSSLERLIQNRTP